MEIDTAMSQIDPILAHSASIAKGVVSEPGAHDYWNHFRPTIDAKDGLDLIS